MLTFLVKDLMRGNQKNYKTNSKILYGFHIGKTSKELEMIVDGDA
jgi:hypothetical protein